MIEGIVTEKDSFQSSEGSLVLASCSLLLCYDFIQMYNLCETLLFDAHCILTWSKFGKREVRCQQLMRVKPFYPNINMHILHTCLYTFPKVLSMKICLTIKSCLCW